MTMLDQSLALIHELKTIENQHHKTLTEEEKKKQRRLKAMRWAIMMGISYAGYSFVRKWLKRRREYKNFIKMGSSGSRGMMLLNEPMRQQQHSYSNSHNSNDNYYSSSPRYHNPGYSYGNHYNQSGYQPMYSSMSYNSPDYSSSYLY